MSYSFDIVSVDSVWNFFQYQQKVEQSRDRSCAYVGSYECTLDGFIAATNLVHHKPDWDWDAVAAQIVNFWLKDSNGLSRWRQELAQAEETCLIVGRVANFGLLRNELETLFDR